MSGQSLYRDVDLIFNDQREYKNGNALVVRTVLENIHDTTIYIPNFYSNGEKVIGEQGRS